jgi:hypothetical protein
LNYLRAGYLDLSWILWDEPRPFQDNPHFTQAVLNRDYVTFN